MVVYLRGHRCVVEQVIDGKPMCPAQVEALELKPVERAEQVPVMVHGTYLRLWPAIGAFCHNFIVDTALSVVTDSVFRRRRKKRKA